MVSKFVEFRKSSIAAIVLVILIQPVYADRQASLFENCDFQSLIGRGDIRRCEVVDDQQVPLYLGNGRFGSCFARFGLHIPPEKVEAMLEASREKNPEFVPAYGKTVFMHMGYWARGPEDYLVQLARVYWDDEPEKTSDYQQYQSFYDGTITTTFAYGENRITVTSWFDAVNRDLAGFIIDVVGSSPDIVVAPVRKYPIPYYKKEIGQQFTVALSKGVWKAKLKCIQASTDLYVKSDAKMQTIEKGLKLVLHEGRNEILLSVNEPIDSCAEKSLERTRRWWHSTWRKTAWLDLPDDSAQKIWTRSIAYILYSCNDDGIGLPPPCGFTGNKWPHAFPQDVSYIHPIFLSTGHTQIAKSWIEYFAARLEGMKEYTKGLWPDAADIEGIYPPWEYPYGRVGSYSGGAKQIHNAGYVCRMAYETAMMVNDTEWTKNYALPLIKETANFYKSICRKEKDGYWHIFILPSSGQDEAGGKNQKDYLCALYSAKYCFQKAVEMGLDEDGAFAKILGDGLALPSLLSGRDLYFTNQGSGEEDFGRQKHPPQLNGLAYLPVNKEVTQPERQAYRQRYDITNGAKTPVFHGWTLGEFLLAGSRIGSVKGWRKDWGNSLVSEYVDPEWIQIYESSHGHHKSFYVTTHGLVAQALLDNLVTTWWGGLDIANCMPWESAKFGNVRTLLGVTVSGEIENGVADLELRAWKDAGFSLAGKQYDIKKGQKRNIRLELSAK